MHDGSFAPEGLSYSLNLRPTDKSVGYYRLSQRDKAKMPRDPAHAPVFPIQNGLTVLPEEA